MYIVRPRRRGLGDTVSNTLPFQGNPNLTESAKCSQGWLVYLTNPDCWGYSPTAWQQQQQFASQPFPVAPPAPPAVTSTGVSETVPPTPEQAQTAIDASLTQAAQAAQAQNLAQSQDFIPVLDMSQIGGGVTGLSTTSLIAIGIAAGGVLLILTSMGGRRRRRR